MIALYRRSFLTSKILIFSKKNTRLTFPSLAYYAQQNKNHHTNGNSQQPQSQGGNQSNNKNEHFKRFALLLAAGAIGGILGYYCFGQQRQLSNQSQRVNNKPYPSRLGGSWRLLNTQSRIFTSEELTGSYYLIYFGYALCPDICPTTLKYLSNVKRHLEKEGKTNLKVVFVSLDPKRDKPEGIRKYLDLFDTTFIGLTGSSQNDQNLKQMKSGFKVYANKIKGQGQGYNIDHTSLVFMMSPNNQLVGIVNTSLTQKQTAQFITNKLK